MREQEKNTGQSWRDARGFNLVELLMALALSTIVFMAAVRMFVAQSESMQAQNDLIDMNREGRFALQHLRQDLTSLASNSTPNSEADPLVCPKPTLPLRAIELNVEDSFAVDTALNPFVLSASMTLFGALDIKSRWYTSAMGGNSVQLATSGGGLPASQSAWDATFSTDRYLRLASPDGMMMFFPIAGSNFATATITITGTIPRQGEGQACGYTGVGANYSVEVVNHVRYRIVADTRPGMPTRPDGAYERTLLVRERLGLDGKTPVAQTILAENAVELSAYDMLFVEDLPPAPLKVTQATTLNNVIQAGGVGFLGSTAAARPQQLRAMTVKLSIRSSWPDKDLYHSPRGQLFTPLRTWKVADDGRGVYRVETLSGRVAMPTMMARDL